MEGWTHETTINRLEAEVSQLQLQLREEKEINKNLNIAHDNWGNRSLTAERLLGRTQKALYGIPCSCGRSMITNLVVKCHRCNAIEGLALVPATDEKRVEPSQNEHCATGDCIWSMVGMCKCPCAKCRVAP